MPRMKETDIRAALLANATVAAGMLRPFRFRAESDTDATELMWSHRNGRLSVYVNPEGGFTIEDIPYHVIPDDDVETIDEVIERLRQHKFLKDGTLAESSKSSRPVGDFDNDDDFPTV